MMMSVISISAAAGRSCAIRPRSLLILAVCIALAGCAQPKRTFLINAETSSPLLEVAVPKSGARCAATTLHLSISQANDVRAEACSSGQCRETPLAGLEFRDRSTRVNPDKIVLGSGSAEGRVEPVVGPDDLLWLCREDEDAQECVCIPWAQD
jgi:hypothetical protein